MKKHLLFFCFVFVSALCEAQTLATWQDTVNRIEDIFSRYQSASPGSQLAISRHGEIIFSKAWGMADLEHRVPLTTESVTEAGSVSKQFVAAALLLLEQQGKLSLNDDVRKYIPELPDYGTPITLRHMMTHTSGLRDWGSVMDIAGWPRGTKTYSNEDALYIASLQKGLNHKPGDEFLYSNTNYNLMAVVVQRTSGLSLADYTRQYIFGPAGMTHTEWRDNYKRIVPNRAQAYAKVGGSYETNMPNEYVYGNGGLLTTAEDLLKWNQYYFSGKFGTPSLLDKQLSSMLLNNGKDSNYAAGLFINNGKVKRVYHSGATAGYRAYLEHFPDLDLSIAWLSNTSEFDGKENVAVQVAALFVNDLQPQQTQKAGAATAIAPEVLAGLQGWYRDGRMGAGVKLFVRDGKLYRTPADELIPVSENTFTAGGTMIEFLPDRKAGLRYITSSKDTVVYTPVDSASISDKVLNGYAGEYFSGEVEAKFQITAKDGKLYLRQTPASNLELRPTYKDGFTFRGGMVYFVRDKKGRVTRMMISNARARNVEFVKQDRKLMKGKKQQVLFY